MFLDFYFQNIYILVLYLQPCAKTIGSIELFYNSSIIIYCCIKKSGYIFQIIWLDWIHVSRNKCFVYIKIIKLVYKWFAEEVQKFQTNLSNVFENRSRIKILLEKMQCLICDLFAYYFFIIYSLKLWSRCNIKEYIQEFLKVKETFLS